MLQFNSFFKDQRLFHRDQRAGSGATCQLLQAQTFLSETFAECHFRQRGQGAQIAYAPTVESFKQAVCGTFLISLPDGRQTKLQSATNLIVLLLSPMGLR